MELELEELIALQHVKQFANNATTNLFDAKLSGNVNVAQIGQGLDFSHNREYVFSDDIRHINWRLTAKNNKPFVKIYTKDVMNTIYVGIDLSSYMEFGSENTFKSTQAIKIAAILGWEYVLKQEMIGFFTNHYHNNHQALAYYKPSNNIKSLMLHLQQLLKLYHKKSQQEAAFTTVLQKMHQYKLNPGIIYLISDFVLEANHEWFDYLRLLQQHHKVVLISIYDKFDFDLNNLNNINFVDKTGKKLFFTTSTKEIAQYREDWLNKKDKLQNFCLKHKITLFFIPTKKVWSHG